jgi:patatin-related protein
VKEKELRLALVCYGGVSLVLYMHGVVTELLKLARASKTYHAIATPERRQAETFAAANRSDHGEHDSEEAYFGLLKGIGRKLDLRVIIDSVAGASAGGVSGILLARALAHDLSFDHLRKMWLEEADVLRLLAPVQRARPWSKLFVYPFLWVLFRLRLLGLTTDREMRAKLSTFLRSRWFEPPFDGDRFLSLLYDGLGGMQRAAGEPSSLLPPGHALDLAVTVTDFFGYPRRLAINTPAEILEREQSLLWSFKFCHWSDGSVVSDFDETNLPGLALAGRATSSLPGVFPPAQLRDVERLLQARALGWPARSRFMRANFREYARAGIDPAKTSFLDGSIVNNKPFSAAITVIRARAAFREVDRRIVYIDPDPERPPPPPDGRAPGFLPTLKAALSDIPSHEPVSDELARIAGFNASIRQMRTVLEAARPQIDQLVSEVLKGNRGRAEGGRAVRRWREAANALAAKQANYAYQIYARLKANSVIEHLIALACELAELDQDSPRRAQLEAAVRAWAVRRGALPPDGALPTTGSADNGSAAAPWIGFLQRFDVDFRRRRLSFVIRAVNKLYSRLDEPAFRGLEPGQLDDLKQRMQQPLGRLRMLRSGEFAYPSIRARLVALAAVLDHANHANHANATPDAAASRTLDERIDDIMIQLAEELDLKRVDDELDEIAGSVLDRALPPALHDEMRLHYIGFAFWDVLTFALPEWRDVQEHDEIRIDRISPVDAASLRSGVANPGLRGAELRHFAGFLSRPHRENDYLWGRLDGAERLIDIVCNAADSDLSLSPGEVREIKKAAFRAILDTEEKFLEDKNLIATVRAAVDGMA